MWFAVNMMDTQERHQEATLQQLPWEGRKPDSSVSYFSRCLAWRHLCFGFQRNGPATASEESDAIRRGCGEASQGPKPARRRNRTLQADTLKWARASLGVKLNRSRTLWTSPFVVIHVHQPRDEVVPEIESAYSRLCSPEKSNPEVVFGFS